MSELLLSMDGISKRFPGVQALNQAKLQVHRGEVVALIGENGAGKSTLMKVLFGLYQPDEGTITYKGEVWNAISPKQALEKGVAMIHQELSIVPTLSFAVKLLIWMFPKSLFFLEEI